MKKFYAILLVLLTTCLCQLHATTNGGFFRVDNVIYQVTNLDKLTVSVFKVGSNVTGTLTIPSTVKDGTGKEFTVTGMEQESILDAPITKVVLPSSMTEAGLGRGCLTCPTLTEIAIDGNSSELKVVDGVLLTASGARLEAYPANKSDKEYTLPASVQRVMPFAFAEARNLETLTIDKACIWTQEGGGKTAKGFGAWANIRSLKNFKVEDGHDFYKVIDGVLYRTDLYQTSSYCLVSYPAGRTDKSFTVPDNVITVYSFAFSGADNLEELDNSKTQYWDDAAIVGCKNLKKITGTGSKNLIFKNNAAYDQNMILKYIGCEEGGTISLPDDAKGISGYAFSYRTFDKVVLPQSVTAIGQYAFWHANIKDVDLSQYSGSIWYYAFMHSKLEKVELPATIDIIYNSAFQQCNNLKSVTIADNAKLSDIYEQAFLDDPVLESINFGANSSIENINASAFALCSKLKSLTIPTSLITLGYGVVSCDDNLAYLDLSNTELTFNAVDRTKDFFDGMDAHTLVFMPQPEDPSSDVTGENIVNVDETGTRTAASIALYSKATSFETPYSFTAKKVTYDRSFTKDTYATVAFPFALNETQTAALGKLYTFQNVADNQAVFENSASSTTTAYQPYLLLSNGTAFSAENVKFEKASENSASGDFAACFEATSESGKLGLNSDFSATKAPVFRTLANGETILPFHAYITSTATSLPVKGAEATNISNIRANGKVGNSVYTLNGSKLSTIPTQPGVYIIGNKKVLVK